MSNRRFSILIPTLNEENYIGGILGDLADQSYKDFEVIVVDAKSKDKTKEAVLKFKDKLDISFYTSPKKGVSFQRNYAAKKAKYNDLIFFDADVLIEKKFLEKIDSFLTNKPVGVLTSWNVPISNRIDDRFFFFLYNSIFTEISKFFHPVGAGVFIYCSKKAFDHVGGFDEEAFIAEDYDLIRRIFNKGHKYALLRDPVIRFSVRRYNEAGRLNHLVKILKLGSYYYKKGPVKNHKLFEYESGKHK